MVKFLESVKGTIKYITGSFRLSRQIGDHTGSGYCQGWSPVEFRTCF